MTDDEYQPVAVSRRIPAPAHGIFRVLANPARHPEFDGSESLRGAGSTAVISGVRVGMDNGNVWAEAMAETLERLDALRAARKPAQSVVGLADRG